jgi:hypothetical protein
VYLHCSTGKEVLPTVRVPGSSILSADPIIDFDQQPLSSEEHVSSAFVETGQIMKIYRLDQLLEHIFCKTTCGPGLSGLSRVAREKGSVQCDRGCTSQLV